ncbi:Clp protease N-terminal domain-containing protein [Actinoplanes sp. CA-252034]|uniref:Clp protease N-terminal domain-containing protein n=1 Tax=Actinoplanes sp. CA-252034 TaxID=3239906 RepID=UPI003D97EEF0
MTDKVSAVMTAAKALGGQRIGTEHLLAGTLRAGAGVRRVLDAHDVTPTVLHAVLRAQAGRWATPDDASAAVDRARLAYGEPSAEQLLLVLLEDPQSHAGELLRECGADVDAVREALMSGRAPARVERMPAELVAVRDRLIGRSRYRGRGVRNYLRSAMGRKRVNYAEVPVLWASLEADLIAKARGGPKRTDDVLRAMLMTYEVACAYPHLLGPAHERYEGVRALVEIGVDWRHVARWDSGDEDRLPVKELLKPGADWPEDTSALLGVLVSHPGSRAGRLLAENLV